MAPGVDTRGVACTPCSLPGCPSGHLGAKNQRKAPLLGTRVEVLCVYRIQGYLPNSSSDPAAPGHLLPGRRFRPTDGRPYGVGHCPLSTFNCQLIRVVVGHAAVSTAADGRFESGAALQRHEPPFNRDSRKDGHPGQGFAGFARGVTARKNVHTRR